MRHREYFQPVDEGEITNSHNPRLEATRTSVILLVISLGVVIGLAKTLTPALEGVLTALRAPKPAVGIVIALLVLLPEGVAALRAARANRLQTSLNLALGSALASIGLTIPAVAIVSIWLSMPLDLGISEKDTVILAVTVFLGVITLGTGRTTILQGVVHLAVFASFLFFTIIP